MEHLLLNKSGKYLSKLNSEELPKYVYSSLVV